MNIDMSYNFDEIIDRRNTNSIKYDFASERGVPEDVLPLWIADMDFKTPPEVTDALVKSSMHGIFGYTEVKNDYFCAVNNWFSSRFDFEIHRPWLVKTPGIVYAICMAIRAFTQIGDAVLIQKPVYYPFSKTVIDNGRRLVNNALIYKDGKYHIDFDDFEKKIVDNNVKLFVFCSPHNPVGRVWTKDELIRIGDICLKHDVIVVSDEIHCDFVYGGHKHHILASLSPEYLHNTITCTAPSKTFNLAGLQISNIFIANSNIRQKFKQEIVKTGYSQHNTMGLVACQSAYKHGRDWVDELNVYLAENLSFLRYYLSEKLPQIKLIEPEGTYLVWLDFSALSLSERELDVLLLHKAKLWLDNGRMFGEEGEGFVRINIACPREILKTALQRLQAALLD